MELRAVEELLEGEEMQMRSYLRAVYPTKSMRTVDRKREIFNQFITNVPPGVLKKMAAISTGALRSFDRIANAALGDIRNAVKELRALPASTEKDAEVYLEKLETKLLENWQKKRKGKPLKKDEGEAAKMATNALLHYMKATELKTSAEKRKFLTQVLGWVMEAQAVSGSLRSVHRTPIPDGILIRRGRPPKRRKEAA